MIGAKTSVKTDKNTAQAVEDGTRETLLDAADRGFRVSQEHVPHGASSTLAQSGFEPQEQQDGSVIWGYRAEYARYVEDGTRAHWAPIEPLKLWARRVLGDEQAAWAVQRKIAEEGTDPQPYVKRGVQAMRTYLRAHGLKAAISKRL